MKKQPLLLRIAGTISLVTLVVPVTANALPITLGGASCVDVATDTNVGDQLDTGKAVQTQVFFEPTIQSDNLRGRTLGMDFCHQFLNQH